MRVTHISFHQDAERRQPESLLTAWPTLLGVTTALVRAGVETSLVQASAHDANVQRNGVNAAFVAERPSAFRGLAATRRLRAPRRVLDAAAKTRPDVLHVNGLQHPLAIRHLTTAFARTPVVVQDHAGVPSTDWKRHVWRHSLARVAGLVFTVREQSQPFLAAGMFSHTTPVFAVLEGSSTFTPGNQADARATCGIHGDPCLLWTGHLDANKDPLMVLDAFERASPHLPDARLWCCYGSAPLMQAVTDRIAQSPTLSDRVTLLGRQPHMMMETFYRAADFFVQGSHREGCSYSTIEALSCGTPSLVTDIPSSRRIVGDAGSLTPVGSAESLAYAIVEWARRDRAADRSAARARFERELSYDAIGHSLRDVYEAVLRRA